MVAPERETPGTSASIWHTPIAERPRRAASGPPRRRRTVRRAALDEPASHAADDEGRGDDAGLS